MANLLLVGIATVLTITLIVDMVAYFVRRLLYRFGD